MISLKGIAIKLLVFVLFVCVFVSGDEVRCIAREREALLSFKNGLVDEYEILSSWRGEECCKWDGIVCSNTTYHVIKLQLNAVDFDGVLQGNISSSLLELHHLNHLDLSGNDFGGNPIPEFIGSIKQLQHLYLSASNFSGIVPPQIGNLTNLRSLDLSYNSFKIENLDWLSSISLLSYLDLSRFDLSDTNWHHHILSLPSLRELKLEYCNIRDVKPSINSSSTSLLSMLNLSHNHLTSSSFDWLSNISTSLVKIDLSSNALGGGPIPKAFIEGLTLIEHLDLSNNTLQGHIPESLVSLSHLRVLVLYKNDFRGSFYEFFGNLSTKGILESLEILDLARNQLSGPVPDLRAFSALTELYLGGNNFTGSVPLNIGQLSKLRILDLSRNSLERSVSKSHFIKLDKLEVLDLSFNSLILHIAPDWTPPFQLDWIFLAGCDVGPSFPRWIQTQRNFSLLDLSRTGIADEIPRWLWTTSPVLEFLLLSDNQISGTIPSLSSTSIMYIVLNNNSISGPIPSFNANVKHILLSENMFTGSISSLCELPHADLQHVDLSNNKLAGELPNCWENVPNLEILNLADNSFSGQIPPSFGTLQLFDVGGNELTGEIPNWIGQMHRMTFLNLARNKFHGSIPPQICNLTRIRILDLSVNNLSGKISDCFSNFTKMAHKNIPKASFDIFGYYLWFKYNDDLPNVIIKRFYEFSSFQWKGQELEYRKSLPLLKLIDFSSNRLTGNIPHSLFSLKGLISLNLSRNSLTGNVIPDIGEMEMIECVDLSHNQLSGRLPTSLNQLRFLSVLDLSNNGLTGNIPHSLFSLKGLISLNLSRNSLTGNVIPDIGEMEMIECVDLSHNQLSGRLPTSLNQLRFLSVLDLSNNGFSGKIPTSTQLQSFNTSAYAGNDGLCGAPLALCPEDSLRPPTTNAGENKNERDGGLSFMQEVGISMGFGFIFGFWGFIGSLVLKKSWRIAFFNFFDVVGEWFYMKAAIFLSKIEMEAKLKYRWNHY